MQAVHAEEADHRLGSSRPVAAGGAGVHIGRPLARAAARDCDPAIDLAEPTIVHARNLRAQVEVGRRHRKPDQRLLQQV